MTAVLCCAAAVWCGVLWCVAVWCAVLCCVVVWCAVVLVWCGVLCVVFTSGRCCAFVRRESPEESLVTAMSAMGDKVVDEVLLDDQDSVKKLEM